ncbi:MAG: MerR family transcriptional regulator [Myxococcota bacterium]
MSESIDIQFQRAEAPATLKIGDLARRSGKSPRALRLYEDMQLLGPAVRTEGGHRLYSGDALLRLQWIDRLQLLGLSLPDIRAFLEQLENAGSGPSAMIQVRGLFVEKLQQVRRQLRELSSLEHELQAGLSYLESCHSCAEHSGLDGCRSCEQPHSISQPVLIAGIHRNGEQR